MYYKLYIRTNNFSIFKTNKKYKIEVTLRLRMILVKENNQSNK